MSFEIKLIINKVNNTYQTVCVLYVFEWRSWPLQHLDIRRTGIPHRKIQLKGGLVRGGHYLKIYEMVSDGSSRSDFLTNVPRNAMRIFFTSR